MSKAQNHYENPIIPGFYPDPSICKVGDDYFIVSGSGIYAPTIRYDESDGTYYMVTTNISNGGNFFVTTKDPRLGWSEPVFLQQQGIDPSLYFENGTCYMLSNPDNCICLCTIDRKTGKQLTPSLVQDTNGAWWMVCLGIRPQIGQNHLLGRETFLAPVRWDKGEWPVVNETGTIALQMEAALPA